MSSPEEYDLTDFETETENVIIENNVNNSSNISDSLYSSGDSIGISFDTSHIGSFRSRIITDSDNNDGHISENGRSWMELPSPVIENIYTYLSRTDQSRMSLVCSRWSKHFNSPCLWKTFKFYLPEHNYSSDIYPEVRFARKYGSMIKHVEIICKRVKAHLIEDISNQLKLFLQAMELSSQLSSIKFINMGNYFRRLEDVEYECLFVYLIRLFYSQENLKTVVFQESRFCKEKGMELLKAIFHSDNHTIRNLTLRGFVNEAPFTILSQHYLANLPSVCCRIAAVQSLEVDYTQIFEDVINCLYQNLSSGDYHLDKNMQGISTLNIYCEGKRHLGLRGILPGTWRYLINVFPNMKVKMDVTIHNYLITEMEKLLVREMPLQALEFRFEKLSSSLRTDIRVLFTYLQWCKYQDHLETLNIFWMPSIANFAGSIFPFIQSCEKLRNFHLHVKCTPPGIENILKTFLENHPTSLKSVTMWFNYLQENENEENFKALSEKYYPLFNAQGIECFLVVDPSRSLRRRRPMVTIL